MFEKEAEESFMCKKVLYKWETDKRSYIDGFKDGYNKANEEFAKQLKEVVETCNHWQEVAEKANEWHYVKDGDLPKDTTSLYLVRVYSWDFGLSHLYKKYGKYIPIVCEWKGEYFSTLDEMAYSNARNIKNCIAWKEIVLPGLKESE